jgi:hypothetical protein
MKTRFLAVTVFIAIPWAGWAMPVSLSSFGVPYTQDFNTLANSGTSSTLPTGWTFSETGSNANGLYAAGTGSSNTGDTYSFGASSSSERALGGLRSGNLIPLFGVEFRNDTGSTIASLAIAYTGEQWRLGNAGRADRLDFQYSLDATSLTNGTWQDFDALDFTSPDTSGSTGLRDGNNPANRALLSAILPLTVPAGMTFWLRWVDSDAAGADDGLAVDDFSLTAWGSPSVTVPEAGRTAGLLGLAMVGLVVARKVRAGLN